ncbi:MAG TPA: EF-hand domain-containing protein [Pirellulales bacterium]|nr:EF-hand domain-containing protein [Pirellulales bacterium]
MSLSISGMGAASAPQIVSGASSYASPTAKMTSLFGQIDAGNTGSITLGQFQQAFANSNPPASFRAQGANAIFNQLDPSQTGSVSKAHFVRGMTALMRSFKTAGSRSAAGAPMASSSSDAASQSLGQSLQSLLQLGSSAPTNNSGLGAQYDASA